MTLLHLLLLSACDGAPSDDKPGDTADADTDTDADTDADSDADSDSDTDADSDTDTDTDTDVDTSAPSLTLISPLDGASVSGTAELSATATDDVGVASVTFFVDGDELAADTTDPYGASWDTTTLVNGNYVVSAVASDAAGNESRAEASVNVENEGSLDAGAVRIINPVDGSTLCGTLTVEAAATVSDAEVVFSLDGTDIAVDTAAPYTWEWNTESTSNGTHSLRATITDADGGRAQNTITVDVQNDGTDCDNLPTVSFTAPETDTWTSGSVDLTASASDDVGVVKVQFFVDSGLLFEDTSIPYGTTWDSDLFDEGPHTIKAIATDTSSQTAETRIGVNIDRTAPVVEITSPGDGDGLEGTIDIEVSATDNLSLAEVYVFVDGVSVATLTEAPFVVSWDSTGADYGTHSIEAVATDAAGNSGIDAIDVDVDNPPDVSIREPDDGDTVAGEIEVDVSASDDDSVRSVTLYVDGVSASSDSASPYAWTWDTCDLSKGSHTLDAVAQDSGRNESTDTVTVTVDQALEVALVGPSGTLDTTETLVAWADDDDAISDVTFSVDGATVATVTSSSGIGSGCTLTCDCNEYEVEWDATSLAEGSHTLTATVTNASGDTDTDSWTVTVSYDADGDGYDGSGWGGSDCDDADAAIHPGATEACDGYDNDCNGAVDDATGCPVVATTADAILEGEDASWSSDTADYSFSGDEAGGTVAIVDDLDGDGHADVVVAASNHEEGGVTGAIYVMSGTPSGTSVLDTVATLTLTGESSTAAAGAALASAGDMDGDGLAELVVGDPSGDTRYPGAVYVIYGGATGILGLGSADAELDGSTAYDEAGHAVDGGGDVDGDGAPDLLVGVPSDDTSTTDAGAVYIVRGPVSGTSTLSASGSQIRGTTRNDHVGTTVAWLGDVDGDGMDDLATGVPYADGGGTSAGAVYFFSGATALGGMSVADAEAYLVGEDSSDYAGGDVTSPGDLDGDGKPDIAVGAFGEDAGGSSAGAVYLLFGAPAGTVDLSTADVKITGDTASYQVGAQVDGAGDLDGDGELDLLVAAPYYAYGGSRAGALGVMFGPFAGSMAFADADVLIVGSEYDDLGTSVSGGRDVDGDGIPDVLVGAPGSDLNGNNAGAAFLFLGSGL